MSSKLHGMGGLQSSASNNNLTDISAEVVKQMMTMVLGKEFFSEGKNFIFINDAVIEDSVSKRRFSFTLTAKEI